MPLMTGKEKTEYQKEFYEAKEKILKYAENKKYNCRGDSAMRL
ncbi:hypothetical protein OFS03_06585 [Brachyspira hyodysenteriae]|nr:hypothetical protein [Brachyspira hyodysenteriae]MDA0062883.1 hypothetical protein [Brachyspira hyodysenteriae]